MKTSPLILAMVMALFTNQAVAQVNLNNLLNSSGNNLGQGLSNEKIIKGLKEALSRGANTSSSRASQLDGFYKNAAIKIPFPPEAKQMEKSLRSIGMSQQVDSFIKTLNRAAEDAATKAAPIFLNAITHMSVSDGLRILRGGDRAATEFLKSGTTPALMAEFKPVVKNSLQKVEITKYWNPLVKSYNRVPGSRKMNPDLEAYVTTKAIDGLFTLIGEEEAKIRKDPVATGSNLLNEVFGGKKP